MSVYTAAIFVKPLVTDRITKRYFFPALTLKMFGAIALGLIYQFYYHGGDTFTYHTHGSRKLWELFMDSPTEGIRAFFYHGNTTGRFWNIGESIWSWRDPSSFFIVQISAFFDLLTFSSYSATAVLFSVLAFIGGWSMYYAFYMRYPNAHLLLALCCLFVPSVIFWGSGILKDTITLAFVGISTLCIYKIVFERKMTFYFLLLIFSFYIIFSVKKYILISLFAGIIAWVSSAFFFNIKSIGARIVFMPLILLFCLVITYVSIKKVMEDDAKYSIDQIANTSMVTAYDIRYGWGARSGDGSGYSLGKLDGTWQNMISLTPAAINVSLFRPYFWEVKNPLMALSALEGMMNLLFTVYVLARVRTRIRKYIKAEVIFCLVFALIFAFGVGISSYNFGTLSRYKIPLLPFYWSALAIIYSSWREDKLGLSWQNYELENKI